MSEEWSNPVRDQSGRIVMIAEPMLPNGVKPTRRGDQVAAEKIEAGWVVGLEYGYDLSRIALSAIYLAMNTQEQSND